MVLAWLGILFQQLVGDGSIDLSGNSFLHLWTSDYKTSLFCATFSKVHGAPRKQTQKSEGEDRLRQMLHPQRTMRAFNTLGRVSALRTARICLLDCPTSARPGTKGGAAP